MHMLLIALLGFWLNLISVKAVFVEDAFQTDWHLENIGIYNCVLSANPDFLLVLSDYDSKSLLSFINATDGHLMFRQVLDVEVSGAMMTPDRDHILLQQINNELFAYDSSSGLPTEDFDLSTVEFRSTCKPDLLNIKLSDGSLQVIDAETQLMVFEVDLPSKFESIAFLETDYASTLRMLVHTTEDEYIFQSIRNNAVETSWTKDESTHDILAHTFIDLTDESLEVLSEELLKESSFPNAWEAYVFRVKTNWHRLSENFRESGYSVGKLLTRALKLDSTSLAASQDTNFGGIKFLVVATKYGVVQAFDVKDGQKVWRFDSGFSGAKKVMSMNYKSDSHELLLFADDGSYSSYSFTGRDTPVLMYEGNLGKGNVKSLSLLDTNHVFVQFLNGEDRLIPLNDEAESSKTFITSHDARGVYGHFADVDGSLKDTWNIIIPKSEQLLAFAGKKEAPIVTLGQTLGNRTVLYKYLYPNLASYITVNSETFTMYVNLIDTLSGELLFTQAHDDKIDVNQPINMVFGEYWFIYSYFSAEPIPEQKIVTVELYESLESDKRISSELEPRNPLKSNHKPAVISKAYFFPEIIKSMTLSETIFGITSKTIVIELENGQITYLSKDVLSARRVEESKMTADDKKAFMAMPYISIIPLNDNFIVTHSRNLLMGGHSELVSSATKLESTSVVCAVGHDIFCTKIYPSGQFDIMSPGFEKIKLVGTIIVLIVICYFIRPSVEAAKLKKAWLVR